MAHATGLIGAPVFPMLQKLRCHECGADLQLGEGHSVEVDQFGTIVAHGSRVVLVCRACCPHDACKTSA